ncbi:T. brucei spp.-specific protein [Trypanosoma brucei gambiense DAL972]|uniref:T. brucei spp.-specific protein n=1 Tax=Trypanosoma brucei gambiense (strain MHOM/CI/86/DAL972) TaxID=679716 RepID=C9ZRL1_TRYB9|nr:T. brucei spp.-specific protein [Trypanosoma brucei gambiense DAL972]CBH12313.1 T. brucei spp.-specific protein [Trypanosoma brucei gambiense DAL972]|eukprot:XP_011774594.1 T. brucei spp.-specific protein [Trypanosoma brucei gambiense DAL972]
MVTCCQLFLCYYYYHYYLFICLFVLAGRTFVHALASVNDCVARNSVGCAKGKKKRCANNSRCCFFFMLSNLSQILWEFMCRSIFSPRCSPIEMYRNAFYMSLLLKSSSFFSFFLLFSFVSSLACLLLFSFFLFWFSCLCDLSPLRNCFLLVLTVIYPVPSTKKNTTNKYIYIYIYIYINND